MANVMQVVKAEGESERYAAGSGGLAADVLVGDALEVLRHLPGRAFQTCVTSPPYYGLRDYGAEGQIGLEATPDAYVGRLVEVFREVRRTLRDDGTLWLNLGDSYAGSWGAQSRSDGNATVSATSAAQAEAAPKRTNTGSVKHLDGIKPKDLLGVPWMVAFALRADGWFLRAEIVWCLSGGTKLYARTARGDRPAALKDLVRLDPATVRLWNGQGWTRVVRWTRSAEPRHAAIEIEFRNGERVGCTPSHLWPTHRGNQRAADLRIGDVVPWTMLPEPAQPADETILDAEVAWFAGRYLADGSLNGPTVQIACHRDEADQLLARLAPVARRFGGTARTHRGGGKAASVCLDGSLLAPLVRRYVEGGNAREKRLCPATWDHGRAWLRALAEGYLAGDGHHDTANDRWRLGFTRNDRLAADLRTLAARIGAQVTLRATHATGFGERWPVYRGWWRWAASGHRNAAPPGEIVALRRSRGRAFWDVTVEDEPHLFALASGLLTHNCKPNPMPESVTDRPTRSHEHVFLLSKSPRYFYDADAIREAEAVPDWDDGTRVFGGKNKAGANVAHGDRTTGRLAGPRKRGVPPHHAQYKSGDQSGLDVVPRGAGRNARDVWTIATRPFRGAHFATMPPDLAERCIRAGSRPGDAVLDPFGGAGTTGLVAHRLQRRATLVEINPAYAELARGRIRGDAPLLHDTVLEAATE